nr:DUF3800 domain-containing protein [Mammaliicoccus sp. Marseille-Q6498]
MNIYVYSDESGVFDKFHEQFFIFGGLIFLDEYNRDSEHRKYINVESSLREHNKLYKCGELKASRLSNKDKGKVFRSLNKCIKFGVVIHLSMLGDNIFNYKKSKQRYLDYAFKIGLKRVLEDLINQEFIMKNDVNGIHVFCDEHTTATNGKYELREALEQEFKCGTFNWNFNKFFPPLFPELDFVNVAFCNSNKKPLIRAADIVANRIYFHSKNQKLDDIQNKVFITHLP